MPSCWPFLSIKNRLLSLISNLNSFLRSLGTRAATVELLNSAPSNRAMSSPKIAVVGAGIIGISSALRILQAFPGAEVTIFAESVSPDTTSDVAAGFWGPSYISNTPHEIVISWGKETYDHLVDLAKSDPQSGKCGVFLAPGFELLSVDDPGTRYWSHIPLEFRRATPSELSVFPSRIKSGIYFISAVAEGSKLIPHLTDQFKALGGKLVENHRVNSFSELQQLGYKHIINCSGLGAMKLCGDKTMFPIRGQVHRVAAPWLKFWFTSDDGTYCLMNTNFAVLGGVAQKGDWNMSVSETDKAGILSRNYAIWPSLRAAPVLADLVGLRPGRDKVRLERENIGDCTIYHNYGHGGSGLTLFWGCAGDIVQLLKADLPTAACKL
ncbi:hypothetical protein BOX15_Mlig028937g1 [Macrostomum lignano]|uniref:Uncharacterized protein n=2 Tax=Macrostomum lignano TaxID=282301 RepID=A0A267G7E8_9PLAT|nr:hypothetical protein BOX15_Mlig028937g1 [Macrostomum lignano]